jgi:hypothetical protein
MENMTHRCRGLLSTASWVFLLPLACQREEDCTAYSLDPACLSEMDTGEEVADTQDSAEPESDLEGTIAIHVVMPDLDNMGDNCVGVLTVQYNAEEVGMEIQGSFDCTWETEFGQQMAEAVGLGVIEGTRQSEVEYSGTAWYGPMTSSWSGTADESGLLSGSWATHQEAMEDLGLPAMDHSGEFEIQLP